MTRVLSELLGAREPLFSRSLQQLESLSGHPQADIRLSTDLQQNVRGKLRELGLDAKDTTGPELYASLGARLEADEQRFATALRGGSPVADDPIAHVAQALKQYAQPAVSYALKAPVARRLLKANLPKKTMKALGYRSADSMIKHETPAALFVAAGFIESSAWSTRLANSYAKLQASDFETRAIAIEHPVSNRWLALAESVVAAHKQTVVSSKELGAVVLLPLPANRPKLAVLTTVVLALRAINDIRASGTFLKLHQMQSGFGGYVQQSVRGGILLPSETLDVPVSWHNLHQYFSRFTSSARTEMFEPVVVASELVWTNIEQTLARIAPALGFWEDTSHLAHQHVANQPVSFNITDVLLSHCNNLSFDDRLVRHFREALQSELLLKYLNHDKLEQSFFAGVQRKLAPEMAMI